MNIFDMQRGMQGQRQSLGEWCGGSYDPNKLPNMGANSSNGIALIKAARQGGHSTWEPGCATCLDPSLSSYMQAACVYFDYNMTNRIAGLTILKNDNITTTATGKAIDFTQILPKLPGGSGGSGSNPPNTPPGGPGVTPSSGGIAVPAVVMSALGWLLFR